MPVDDRRAAPRPVRDDVDRAECGDGLVEHARDVELVGDVRAHRDRDPAGGEDRLDGCGGRAWIAQVDDDDGEAPQRELARELATGRRRAAGDDRYGIGGDPAV